MSNASDPSQNPAHEHYYVDPNWPDPNGPHDAREYAYIFIFGQWLTCALFSDHNIWV